MPKIPTFTAQARPTAEAPGVKTGIQVSPSNNIATALLPSINAAIDYSVKQRDVAEKIEAAKKVFEIKGELDKYIQSEKENINEGNAINNFQKKYTSYVDQQLIGVDNKRIKEKIKQNLSLEYSEYTYNIKKNSYAALEKEGIKIVNDQVNSLSARYATTENPILKVKYKTEAKSAITQFVKDFSLPENVLDQKLKAIDRQFLFSDMNQLVGLENGDKEINQLDNALKGTNFLNDADFGVGVFNAYNAKISELTIKGDPNSDYDRALELTDKLEKFQRSNGYKVSNGELSIKIDSLKEKVLTEKIQHDTLVQKQGDNKLFFGYSNDLRDALVKDIADPYTDPNLQDRLASAEIEAEYNQTIKTYLRVNQDASLPEKKEFARSLIYSLKNIYEDRNISNLNRSILDQNRFDIQGEYQRVLNDMKLLNEKTLNPDIITQYKNLAKINGYTIEGKDGKKEGDIKAFINEYLPVLQSQITIISTRK
tara:strand:- start:2537 stop:3982 length:1446 start_codon:yes stop_codon:yes gene_type:complete